MFRIIKKLLVVALAALAPQISMAQDAATGAGESVLQMPDSRDKLKALDDVIRRQDNIDSVLKYVDIQQKVAKDISDTEYIIKSKMAQAKAYNKAYVYTSAITHYNEALDLCRELGDSTYLGDCYNELANNLSRINDYNMASKYYNQALFKFIEMHDDAKSAEVYRNLGGQCVNFHLYETANGYFKDAFDLDMKMDNKVALGLDYYYVGKSDYCQFLDLDSLNLLIRGISNMRKSLDYAMESDSNQRSIMGCYEQLMLMYVSYYAAADCPDQQMAKDSARHFYELSRQLRDKLNPHSRHMVLDITNANFMAMDGKTREATMILTDLEDLFDQQAPRYNRYRSFLYRSLIWVFKTSGRYKEAVEYSEKFKDVEESSYNREFAVKSTKDAAEAQYNSVIKRNKELEDKAREEQQKRTNEQRMVTIYFAVCIILAAILAFIIWKGLVRKRNNNNLLAQQKIEIEEKNNELQVQNQKIMSQKDEILSQRDEIESQRSQLSEANSRITASIRYAQRIQTAAVPSNEMLQKIFGECMVYWKPLNIVSGDFFWATQAGKYKLITAADCTGHGVPGAFMSMLGVSTLNDIAAQKDIEGRSVTASAILDELREKIIAALRQSGPQTGAQDGMDMALCIVDTDNMELQFSGANRPLWLVRGGELEEYRGDRMPVGYHIRKNAPFSNTVIPICKGDVIYMGSDGLTDQFGGKETTKFKYGSKQLKELLVGISQKPFDEQKQIIEDTMNEWRTKEDGTLESQLDDQILVGIRI